jgi:hypothetical protein
LAIAPHEVDGSKWIFSTGWWSDPAGDARQTLFTIEGSKPTPDKLTVASGMVAYQLVQFSPMEPATAPARTPGAMAPYAIGYTLGAGMPSAVVALQMNADGSLHQRKANLSPLTAPPFAPHHQLWLDLPYAWN